MPKQKASNYQNIKYVSLIDFCNRVDQIKDANERRRFAVNYLMSYSKAANPDYTLAEAIHIAKLKVVEALPSYSQRKNDDKEAAVKHFIARPIEHLKGYAEQELHEINSKSNKSEADNTRKEECEGMLSALTEELRNKISDLNKRTNALDVKVRMEAKYGSKEALEAAYDATKPSFLSQLFGSSSNAGKNLDTMLQAFNNPKHVYYGDIDSMQKACNEYIHHIFPSWEEGDDYPSEEEINRLKGTQKARVLLSIAMLKATDEQIGLSEEIDDISSKPDNHGITFDVVQKVDQEFDNSQGLFQDQVNNEIGDNSNNVIKDNDAHEIDDLVDDLNQTL